MRVSISNIAWDTRRMDEFLALIARLGCDLELSPSMIWPEPLAAPAAEVKAFGRRVAGHGIAFSSMHSLTYSRPDLSFFLGEPRRRELVAYVVGLGRLCGLLGIPRMVFGSAQARRIGDRDRQECFGLLSRSFREMAEGLEPMGVMLLVEPLSRMTADSIVGVKEGMALVTAAGHRNLGLHVDLKSTFEEAEDQDAIWRDYGRHIRHCHAADPGLRPPSDACPQHRAAAAAMRRCGYRGYVSIEMARCEAAMVEAAIRFVQEIYGG